MRSPSSERSASPVGAVRSRLSLSRTHWLLLLVGAMAVACGLALWSTLQQARLLGQPNQHGDLWHVANVHSELGRVQVLARQLQMGKTVAEELDVRLDVLTSVLDGGTRLPQLRQRLQQRVPETAATLGELAAAVTAWSLLLDERPAADVSGAAATIASQADVLQQRVRLALAEVHVAGSDDSDIRRQELQQRFLLLSLVLAGLLLGAAALIWQLIFSIRQARDTTRTLSQTNQVLEARVMERTRKIEEGRLLLNFILDASPSEVLLIDAQTSRVSFINDRLMKRLGLTQYPTELALRDVLSDASQAQALIDGLERYGEVEGMEALLGHHPPAWSALSVRLIEVDGRLCHLLWGFDISAHKRLENQLRELATTDVLTGLDNRRAFMDKGSALLEHCRRHRQNCAVLMLDIDRFKTINDLHGHQAGDAVLVACAQAVRAAVRDADIVGRLGGEEFAAVLPHADLQSARETAERVRAAIETLHIAVPGTGGLGLTVSIGFTAVDGAEHSLEALLSEADFALYRAKADGRNRVVAYQPASQTVPDIPLDATPRPHQALLP